MDAQIRDLVLQAVANDDKPLQRSLPDSALDAALDEDLVVFADSRWWLTPEGLVARQKSLRLRRDRQVALADKQYGERAAAANAATWRDPRLVVGAKLRHTKTGALWTVRRVTPAGVFIATDYFATRESAHSIRLHFTLVLPKETL
ncbi:MAG: hypothetical protein ACYTFV_08950 [Planctomycetota bacterium]|jgi:hypothetical protein